MNEYISGNTVVKDNQVWINGTPLPPAPCKGYNLTVINDKVFIDGYEYKNGKWKRTLRALWHLWF
jgi:hypothetical protein